MRAVNKDGRGDTFIPDEFSAEELEEACQKIRDQVEGGGRSKCPKCGEPLGATKTMDSDGRYYHPECVRGW